MPLIRLAYASEATFKAQPLEKGIEPHVGRILMVSRLNNDKTGLVGGLYYGDNRFFQYLEGDADAVRETYRRIRQDTRHKNVRTLIEEPLERRTFSSWSMKYVPASADVQAFLARHNLPEFNPLAFDSQQCEEMIDLIHQASYDHKLAAYGQKDGVDAAPARAQGGLMKWGLVAVAACLIAALAAGFVLT